jgi:cell wall-associated NlpC family hydrolase
MTDLDRRTHAYRPDIADERLKGRVTADRFVAATPARVVTPVARLFRRPAPDAPLDTEALRGDPVRVFEAGEEGWNWVQLGLDDYVGWMAAADLGPAKSEPTHRVTASRTLVFSAPDIKSSLIDFLPLGASVRVVGQASDHNADYALIDPAGAIVTQHLGALDDHAEDFVAVAETLVGTPYLWGGTSTFGIDCSGLVQLSLRMAGRPSPRDSDMQEATLGEPLATASSRPQLRRGDLVFWGGHLGIMLDGERLLHANVHHMTVAIEPLAETIARLDAAGLPVTSIRRLADQ